MEYPCASVLPGFQSSAIIAPLFINKLNMTGSSSSVPFHGLPCLELRLPDGAVARIALRGAQVLSWQGNDGVERLYLSPKAVFDGKAAIRGGIPVCFPQFNQRVLENRALPKHGFARTLPWRVGPSRCDARQATQSLLLTQDDLPEALQQAWPFRFEACLVVQLEARRLTVTFSVTNRDPQPLPFALALHSYFRVDDISATSLEGLQGCMYWDAVTHLATPQHLQPQQQEPLAVRGETDRVYHAAPPSLVIRQGSSSLKLEQSAQFTETVVWNPGETLCRQLTDMPEDGYRHMLCVEAARINSPATLAPGGQWQGSQTLVI